MIYTYLLENPTHLAIREVVPQMCACNRNGLAIWKHTDIIPDYLGVAERRPPVGLEQMERTANIPHLVESHSQYCAPSILPQSPQKNAQ